MSSLTGDYLFKILQEAKNSFSSDLLSPINSELDYPTFSPSGDDASNDSNTGSDPSNASLTDADNNTRVLTDIFDRPLSEFQSRSIDTSADGGGQDSDDGMEAAAATASKFGNRVIINYKNNITSANSDGTFYSKINKPKREDVLDKYIPNMNPSINTIVKHFNNALFPATMHISYADFLYCKKVGAYPNNRLVILRRYAQPVADDLIESSEMNTNQIPLSVMVTWFDEFPMDLKFGEAWTKSKKGLITQLLEVASELVGAGSKLLAGKDSGLSSFMSKMGGGGNSENIGNPWLASLWYGFLTQQANDAGVQTNFARILPNANPNLIREAMYRDATSLSSSISFNLTFEYVLRSLNRIDPHVAMHNIIANIIRMGTSTSVSVYPRPNVDDASVTGVINDLANGRIIESIKGLLDQVRTFNELKIKSSSSNPTGDEEGSTTSNTGATTAPPGGNDQENQDTPSYTARLLSIYRFKLIAALQADTGLPSGNWHVTVGNPFNPIVSVGDLVITDQIKMEFGKELSYNDFPTEIKATVTLKSARSRGSQDLERIFNAGRGRIYVYPTENNNPDYSIGEYYNAASDARTSTGQDTTDSGRVNNTPSDQAR